MKIKGHLEQQHGLYIYNSCHQLNLDSHASKTTSVPCMVPVGRLALFPVFQCLTENLGMRLASMYV